MNETKRQKQVSRLLREEISDIFKRLGLNILEGGMITITSVQLTPDLLEARIYLSVFNIPDKARILELVREKKHEIKRQLAARVRNQLRRIPETDYFLDETLDYVFKMEELFKKIRLEEGHEPEGSSLS
ncbi:MAG TPA: ribosome-binding factor A [Chitinophagaceae bacterium]|nr:ribosome-binding factor A [Chitinophagaceae bacterium]